MSQKKLESARNVFFTALGIDMAVTALVAIADFWALGILNDARFDISRIDQSTISTMEFWESFSKVTIFTLIGVGLALVRWIGACYEHAKDTLKATGFIQEGWQTWGWIVPFMNLFKPYQVLGEIYKAGASDYASADEWKRSSGSSLLLVWWIFWVIAHMIMMAIGKEALKNSFRNDLSLNQVVGIYYGSVTVCVISLIVASLWFVVAGNLTRRLLVRPARTVAAAEHNSPPVRSYAPVVATASNSSTANFSVNTDMTPLPTIVEPKRDSIDSCTFQSRNENMEMQSVDVETPDFFQIAWDEVSNGTIQRGIWARAYSETEGDEQKTKAMYIKLRVPQLEAEYTKELLRKQTEERERRIREEHDLRIQEEELSRPENMAKHGLLVCSVDRECNELGIKPGDVIIFCNGIDVRNNKSLFVRQLESANSSEQNIIRLVREKQFVDLTVRGGKLGLQVSELV